jgi:uncharacterized damage-inducible protein DinB
MAGDAIDRFRRWFDYEQDAHEKVLASFDSVPPDRRGSAEFRRAVSLFGHIVAARRMWLFRLGVTPTPPVSFFPDDADASRVSEDWREVQGLWRDFLAQADDAALAREFEYKSLDAGRFRNRVEDILAQLFGHSWYHRGQIAILIRAAGGEPAVTDLIYWCRESIPDATGA